MDPGEVTQNREHHKRQAGAKVNKKERKKRGNETKEARKNFKVRIGVIVFAKIRCGTNGCSCVAFRKVTG